MILTIQHSKKDRIIEAKLKKKKKKKTQGFSGTGIHGRMNKKSTEDF